jgi:hypothetical protein
MALFARLGIEPEQRAVESAPQTPDPRFYDAADQASSAGSQPIH